ncbi:hypothetical protein DUI87_02293 [Hirundo rustica rustica]|uniref:ribonuclease H n=1 Tax=Hirundo rustica rustica TaxID=333673 RepID=A0A3M0LQT2_HIRRU|nr:hypothetical protein DUI87_02293 [Hirundo rustica rustica]
MTYTDHDMAQPILTTNSKYTPYRLQLTEGLHLKDDNWNFVSVDNSEQGTWPRVKGKLIVVGDCKHTPKEIEILPGTLDNNPGKFVLWLRCTHPPTFLPKGQTVAQIIPTWEHLEEDNIPTACPVRKITEVKSQVGCELQVGDEAINITGLLHTDMDVTVIPAKHWPSRWALENVAGHVQGIGGMQLAKQSKSVVQIKGPKGQLASLRPFVLDYREPLLGRDLMAQWGVTIDIPDPPQDFWAAVAEERPTHKLNWKTDAPVWVEQWPLSKQKLKALEELVEEQLAKGHIVETTSPWNSPVFVIRKPGKDKWRLLQDLRQINNVIEDMGSLQPGMPTPTMLPQNWKLAVIDIKDCFFHIPLHPDDAPRFAFSVPTVNREAPRKRYHWRVLPQGMKVSPIICQWYVASLLSPVRVAAEKAIIHHYMDDVLVCAPTDDVLSHALDLTINALVVAGFELQEDKVQRMPPWRYLGLEIGKRTIVPQKLEIKAKIQTLADVHQLCGALNWVRPWLGLTTEDLAPLFNLLKGGEELSSPRELTPEAKEALEKVQHLMSTRQAHRCDPDLPFKFIIMGKLPHLHGVIFQWRNNIKKDQGREDPLLIIEWVFLSHQRSKRMTRPEELVAELIRKARVRIRELAGCDFECIHIPIGLRSGQITKAMLEHLLQENEALQFALDSFTGQISIHRPAHKIFNQDAKFTLNLKDVRSRKPLEALTVFTDASGKSHKSVMTWKDPQTQQWEADVAKVEGSPQNPQIPDAPPMEPQEAGSNPEPPEEVQGPITRGRARQHNLYPLREMPVGGCQGPHPAIGFVSVPLSSGDVREFKREMGSLLEDPLGVAERLDQFLGPSIYTWGELQAILNILFTAEERNMIRQAGMRIWDSQHAQGPLADTKWPLQDPNWNHQQQDHRINMQDLRGIRVQGIREAVPRGQNINKAFNERQKKEETPTDWLERLRKNLQMYSGLDPETPLGQALLKTQFVAKSWEDIRKKLEKLHNWQDRDLDELLKEAQKVYVRRDEESHKRQVRMMVAAVRETRRIDAPPKTSQVAQRNGGGVPRVEKKDGGICFYCGNKGHFRRNCRKRLRDERVLKED